MKSFLKLSASMIALISAPALAQQSGAPADEEEIGVRDIVVTAQRRAESLQDISIAATVVSGDTLAERNVVRQLDLQNIAPGISIVKAGLTESINIRGIGLASGSPNVSNGVSNYLDGIFQPPIVSTGSFYDIQNVELLRGPQGTLVGSSSTGGALLINSNRPQLDRLSASIGVQYGSYDNIGGDVAVNLPVGESLAVRVAGLVASRDSYYTDIGRFGNKPDRLSERDLRISTLYKSGGFEAYAKVELVNRESGGYAYQPILGTALAGARTAATTPPSPRYTLNYNSPTSNIERAKILAGELKYEFENGLVIRSLTGYQNKRINNLYDSDGTSAAANTQDQFVRERQLSQEFNIISDAERPFNFILGGYYQRNKIEVNITNGNAAGPTQFIAPNTNKRVFGLFGQVNYRFSPQWELQVGARYNDFAVTGGGTVTIVRPPAVGNLVIPQPAAASDNKISGKIALNFKPNDDHLFYAFVARGYKPGGANPGAAAGNPTTFLPETVIDYELGWKGSFMDRRIQVQLGAYYNDYSNFQQGAFNVNTGTNNILFNVAGAKIKGIEAQMQARFGGFRAEFGMAYTDTKLSANNGFAIVNTRLLPAGTNRPQCTATLTTNCFDYTPFLQSISGGPALFAPKITWNAAASYEFPVSGEVTLTPRIQYSHVAKQFTNLLYNPVTDLIGSHNLLAATVTLKLDKFKVEAYANNLANEFYVAGQNGNNEFYGAPREFGVRLRANF